MQRCRSYSPFFGFSRILCRLRVIAFWILLTGGYALADPSGLSPVAQQAPEHLVADLVERTLHVINDPSLGATERETRLRDLARQYFDRERIARFVAGRAWRDATDEQRRSFVGLFDDYVLRVYAARVTSIDPRVRLAVRSVGGEGAQRIVESDFIRPDGAPPIKATWMMLKGPEGFRIVDVRVDGISLAATQRDEFAAVLQRAGGSLEDLMNAMRRRIDDAEQWSAQKKPAN